jgi:hypothetical protein
VDQRVADLLGRMTVEEKIRQLDMYWGREIANMSDHEASYICIESKRKREEVNITHTF